MLFLDCHLSKFNLGDHGFSIDEQSQLLSLIFDTHPFELQQRGDVQPQLLSISVGTRPLVR